MASVPYVLLADFLPGQAALFDELVSTVAWDSRMAARRTASFGVPYNYSQMTYPACQMHPALVPVSERLKSRLGVRFNNCLLNYYETGANTMGFHSDDTSNLQPGTGVAIVSLGATRSITFRSKSDASIRSSFALEPGSLLYIDSLVQEEWLHAIRKQSDAGPRISLTWRAFREESA